MTKNVRRPHPDDKCFFDRIEVALVERWKTSGMSGDEWRFSWRVQCSRKGRVLLERWCHDHAYALALAQVAASLGWELCDSVYLRSRDDWETPNVWKDEDENGVCCQPGCAKKATVRYRMKREYDRSCFFSRERTDENGVWYREFCEEHKERGDCGLDDGVGNYEAIPELRGA